MATAGVLLCAVCRVCGAWVGFKLASLQITKGEQFYLDTSENRFSSQFCTE